MAGGFGEFLGYVVAIATQNWWLLATTFIGSLSADQQAARARRQAIAARNAAAKDRLEMLDLQPDAARTLVLGRVRYVEGVRDRWTSGVNDDKLTMIVSFAGHEIDAFEQFYLDDTPVTLDVDGWVQEAPWRADNAETFSKAATLDGAGNATVTLDGPPPVGSYIDCTWTLGSGQDQSQGTYPVSVSGSTATVTGGAPGRAVQINYTLSVPKKYVRIRAFTGAPSQDLSTLLTTDYPGKVASTDKFKGFALAVVDVMYEPDVFPTGRPTVTALMRGAKCYDPRTGNTVWTRNPALHRLKYATWPSGWALSNSQVRLDDISTAANFSDTSTVFSLRKADGSLSTVTLPRYQCDITIPDDADHEEAMNSILETMAGASAWANGTLRTRCGMLNSTVATITADWLCTISKGGQASDEPVISAVQTVKRDKRWNRITGKCVDPSQRYQLLPFPRVQDPVLVAAKGPRPNEVLFEGVSHIAQAQHLGSIIIRQAQAGLQLELTCGLQAGELEPLDVVALTLPKYGYAAKTFEVVSWRWAQDDVYKLRLAEITSAMFEPLAELTGRDPAPDTTLRPEWDVEDISITGIVSGTPAVTDGGSIITRTVVSITPAVGANIRRGGRIEVQYTEAGTAVPAGDWPSWPEEGTASRVAIPGLMVGRRYLFRARVVQTLPLVRGAWSPVVAHQVSGAPLVQTAGIAPDAATEIFEEYAAGPITRSNLG